MIDQSRALVDPMADPMATARSGPVLVALDGSQEGEGTLALAWAFATHLHRPLRAISVCEPRSAVYEQPSLVPLCLPSDPALDRAVRRRMVATQLTHVLGTEVRCPVNVPTGLIADEVADHAADLSASLVVAGRKKHGPVDRLLGEEHLSRLLRLTPCPVLAVDSNLLGIPYRVMVGIDFGENSSDVLRAALSIVAPSGTVHVVHVQPPPSAESTGLRELHVSLEKAEAGLLQLVERMGQVRPTIDTDVLIGHPAAALAAHARHVRAEVLAVGTHGMGFVERFVSGSTTQRLVRLSPCSLLAVPRSAETVSRRI